ncbi:MAG: hypothetical protein ACK4JB_23100 [Reyranella sp.]
MKPGKERPSVRHVPFHGSVTVGLVKVGFDVRASGILLAIAFSLGACATVPMASPTADVEGKRFDPPSPGQSALYLYRSSVLGSEVAFSLNDNQQPIGSLANGTWIRADVAPGRHVITCSVASHAPLTQTPAPAATVDLAPGEIRFLEVDIWPGLPLNPRCVANEVSADRGRAEVAGGNRAMAAN